MANAEYKSYKANIRKLYLQKFFSSIFFLGGVLVPFFTEWGKISFAQIMLLQSWFALCLLLLQIPAGAIADRTGRKKAMVMAGIFHIAFVFVYASAPNFYVFMLGEFLAAVAISLTMGAEEALAYDTLKKLKSEGKSKEVFGRLRTAMLAGIAIGAPIGSIIGANLGLRAPILLSSIPFTIALLISLSLKEPDTEIRQKHRSYISTITEGLKFFHNNKILKILAFDMIAITTVAYFIIWLHQPMLKQAGVGISYFGIVYAAFVIGEIAVVNSFQKIEKILGSKERLLFLSSAATGMAFIIGGLTTFVPAFVLAIIVGGAFGLSRDVLFTSYMNKYIPSEKRATVLSTIYMISGVAKVIVIPIVGMLAEWSLSYTLIILGAAAIIFALISKVEEAHLID